MDFLAIKIVGYIIIAYFINILWYIFGGILYSKMCFILANLANGYESHSRTFRIFIKVDRRLDMKNM